MELFSQRLRYLREKRRVSRAVLSELCGFSKSVISKYERGERRPRMEAAIQLAEYFDVSLDWLFGRV